MAWVVGLLPGGQYEQQECQLQPGDLLAIFSDGIPRRKRRRAEFGEARLGELLAKYADEPLDKIIETVTEEVRKWIHDPTDVTTPHSSGCVPVNVRPLIQNWSISMWTQIAKSDCRLRARGPYPDGTNTPGGSLGGSRGRHRSRASTYVTIPMEITVNRPAAEVWKGWASTATSANGSNPCTITSGKDGEVARCVLSPARSWLADGLSYTYTQSVQRATHNLYHGTWKPGR